VDCRIKFGNDQVGAAKSEEVSACAEASSCKERIMSLLPPVVQILVAHDPFGKPEGHPRIKSEGKLFPIML
jgi:hypothetical protein